MTDVPTITTDIVIIGSGMGGGTLAYALRDNGRQGAHPRAWRLSCRASPRTGARPPSSSHKRYRTTEHFLDGDGKLFRPSFCYGVGGNTKVYGAALPRLRREDFGVLETEDGVSPAWPITYEELEPYYAEAERIFKVHGEMGADPIEPPRSTPYPFPAVPHEPVIAELAESFRGQGLKPYPLPARHRPPARAGPASAARPVTASRARCSRRATPRRASSEPALESPDV